MKSSFVQRLHWPGLSTIRRPWISITAALASRSRWTRNSIVDRDRLLEEAVLRPDDAGPGRLVLEGQPRPLPAAFVERLGGRVLGEVLVGAVGAEHVGRAHAADAAVMAVVRRAGRIVGRQVVEGRGDARGVEVVPERRALAPQHGRGRLVVERPEVELEPVVAHLPGPLAGHGLGGRVERGALLLRDGGG